MNKRGRPPKPTQLKILRGDPSRRGINGLEPIPQDGTPCCPAWLPQEAKAEWRRIVRAMPSGLYTKVDRAALTVYCEAWAEYVELAKKRDQAAAKDKAATRWRHLAIELGLTPSARSRLHMPANKKQETDFERLMRTAGG